MKTLIIYYSLEGNTKRLAEIISTKLDADLQEIKAKVAYISETAMKVSKEHVLEKQLIDIEEMNCCLEEYDQVIIGTPVWWYTMVPVIRTAIHQLNLTGKIVKVFCTHAGDLGHTLDELKELCYFQHAKEVDSKGYYTGQAYKNPINEEKWQEIAGEIELWVK